MLIESDRIFFRYSNQKLKLIEKLMAKETITFIKNYLNGIKKNVESVNKDISNTEKIPEDIQNVWPHYSQKYLSSIFISNNNLISYTQPQSLNIRITENTLKTLYLKFIADDFQVDSIIEMPKKLKIVQENLYPKIESRVNLDVDINNISIPEIKSPKIILPNKINIIGKNGRYMSGQFFDFEKQVNFLKAELSSYTNFIHDIDNDSTHFVIGDEPGNRGSNNHRYWEEIRDFDKISYVSLDEIDKIRDFIYQNDVHKIDTI